MSKEECECKDCNKPTSGDKWRYSLYTLIVFIIVVNPMTYKLVNKLLVGLFGKIADAKGCPTMLGLVVHSLVFLLGIRYIMDLDI
jgi:hypothetical protein